MNRVLSFLLSAATSLVVVGCLREQAPVHDSPRISIRAYIPEEPLTKASFTAPTSGPGLHLAWQANDNIRVINVDNPATSEVFEIQEGFTDHVATFSGKTVAGDQFNIICPGSLASVAEAEIDKTLTQTGNGSTSHLVFTAMLDHVTKDDLPEVTFSEDWANAHPGTSLKRGGVVKMVLTLPDALSQPTKVVLTAPGVDVAVNIADVDLSSEHVLTAYAPSGWEDIPLPDGTDLTVAVYDAEGAYYSATTTLKSDKVLMAGAQNIISLAKGFAEQQFAGGNGTQAHPYLIATAKQLDNMHSVLSHENKVYFRLIDNIDMQSYLAKKTWVPLNWASPYDYAINFDGNHHTINHFTCTHANQSCNKPAFFGLLYGECYDVTFTNASINNNSNVAGILAGYCGYPDKPATVSNVHVQGSVTQTAGQTGVGGLAGRAENAVISSCSANVTINSSVQYTGGLVGVDSDEPVIILNCWTSGTVTGTQRVGGIMGGVIVSQSKIINCFSTATVNASRCLGGIAGHCNMGNNTVGAYDTTYPDNMIQGCIAWQTTLATGTQNNTTDSYWSSGAILGYTSRHTRLTNCKRNPNLSFTDYNPTLPLYDQANATAGSPLAVTNPNASLFKHLSPYHGRAATSTNLSNVARSLGWSEVAWDLNGSVPVLTGVVVPLPSSGDEDIPDVATTSRAFPTNNAVTNGLTWTVKNVRDGIRYYRGYGIPTDGWWSYSYSTPANNQYQEIFVVDLDLSNTGYDVKIVVTSSTTATSNVFSHMNAVAAINGGYEKGSIAVKANTLLNTGNWNHTDYSLGYPYSFMPNNTIGTTGVPNWKSEGAFYSDGHRGVRIAFDAYNGGATGKTATSNTTLKSIEEMRDYYTMSDETAFISSAPILDANYVRFGMSFYTRAPEGTNSESPKVHQGSCYSRTAVAIAYPNGDEAEPHLLLIVNDGKYAKSTGRGYGMSAYQLERIIANNFGPKYMLNLDGGGSSTMCVEGEGDATTHVVNYPSDNYTGKTGTGIVDHGGERKRDSFIVIVPAN